MSPVPRIAHVPLTSKIPEACPHCGSHVLTRRGTRRKKLEIVQLWRCASCKKTFTPGPAAIRNKTYPLRTVIDALAPSSLGSSLEDTAARVKSKSGRHIGASTVAGWLAQHKDLMSYLRLRDKGPTPLPSRADHPLDQTLSPANLSLLISSAEARVPAPWRARR